MPRSLVIVDPNASRLRDRRVRASLVERLGTLLEHRDGAKPEVVVTRGPGDTRPAVEAALADGVASVIGVGGDGTQRDIAAVLNGSAAFPGGSAPLGIVPAGTGNQLAAVLGIPLSLGSAADALLRTRRRRIDLGRATLRVSDDPVREDIFTIGCGVGFDARIMATTPETWKRRLGRTAYFLQALRLAMSVEALPYRLTIDGRTIETEASIALVGNMGQLVPGRLDLRLPIVPDDGLLDLIVVGARGPFHGLKGLAISSFAPRSVAPRGPTACACVGGSSPSHPTDPSHSRWTATMSAPEAWKRVSCPAPSTCSCPRSRPDDPGTSRTRGPWSC